MQEYQMPKYASNVQHSARGLRTPCRRLWGRRLLRACNAEGGSITVFSLFMLVSMIGIGGLAVNTMYAETKRVELQDAADRCALMAAIAQNRIDGGSTTNLTAAAVATDCLNKSSVGSVGMNAPVVSTQNNERTTRNSERTVTLSGSYTFSPIFANTTGAQATTHPVTARANQRLPNLEISVVIDVMNTEFIRDVRAPLIAFLNTVAAPDTGNKVSVNVIPFSNNVYLGTTLLERFADQNRPSHPLTANRACLTLPDDLRDELALPMNESLNWSWPVNINTVPASLTAPPPNEIYVESTEMNALSSAAGAVAAGDCNTQAAGVIPANNALVGVQVTRPVATNANSALSQKITNLTAVMTSQHLSGSSEANSAYGMRWALAFKDPSTQQVITNQISAGISPSPVAGRPQNYRAADSLKIVIFMPNNAFLLRAGGNNREMRPEFITTNLAPIWRTSEAATIERPVRYSIHHPDQPGPNKYWVTQGFTGGATPAPTAFAHWAAAPFQYPSGAAAQQTWQDVWNRMTLSYAIRQLYMAPMANFSPDYHWQTMLDRFTYQATTSAQARSDFAELCSEAKEQGILIYTMLGNGTANIGGAIPTAQAASTAAHNAAAPGARTLYQQCATSPAHTFTIANQAQIRTALRMIASNIAQLTLTQ
jgi:hypothetical protein